VDEAVAFSLGIYDFDLLKNAKILSS